MVTRTALLATSIVLALLAPTAKAGSADFQILAGHCPGPQLVSFEILTSFQITGGDFAAGAGTATVTFTLQNTSGLYPTQEPALGNPILSRFYFNVPEGTGVAYSEARILPGATVFSTGITIGGEAVPAGCSEVSAVQDRTSWYELEEGGSTGQYGVFTYTLGTVAGISAGLVSPEVFADCVAQGDVFAPAVVAGMVQFEILLSNLDTTFNSAAKFRNYCSLVKGSRIVSTYAGKMQGTGVDGEESCFLGLGCPVPVEVSTWGSIKARFH